MSVILLLGFLLEQNTYKEDAIASKIISSSELKIDLERSLSFGKPYTEATNFFRLMRTMIAPIAKEINLHSIVFIDDKKQNNILYSFSNNENDEVLAQTTLPEIFSSTKDSNELISYHGYSWIKVNLYKKDYRNKTSEQGEYAGAYIMSFPENDFSISLGDFVNSYILQFIAIFIISTLILYLLIFKSSITFFSADGHSIINKIYLYSVVLIAQIALSSILLYGLYDFFVKDSQNILQSTAAVQAQKITRLLQLGLPIEMLKGSDEFFTAKLGTNQNVYAFNILDKDKKVIINATMGKDPHSSPPTLIELKAKDNSTLGYVETKLDAEGVKDRFYSAIADLFTILLISLLASSEAMFLFALPSPKKTQAITPETAEYFMGYTRFVHAMIGCAYTLALSFLPLKMLEMMEGRESFIDPMVASSLPLSAELFGAVTSFYLSGRFGIKYGWQRALLGGGSIYTVAATLSAFAPTPEILVASRALAGFGYGFVFLPILMHATSILPDHKKGTCFAMTNAGFVSGFMMGASTGGILVTQTSSELPFLLAAFICASLMTYIFFNLRPFFAEGTFMAERRLKQSGETAKAQSDVIFEPKITLFKYVSDRSIWGTLGLILIPFAAAQIGLSSYVLPITFADFGYSPATVGRAIMLYGLIQVYIAPSLSLYFETFSNKKLVLTFGVIITVAGLFFAGINAYTLFLSVAFVGVAGALVYPMSSAFTVNQPISVSYGTERSVMIFNLTDKIGQALGPICLGALFSTFSYDISLIIMGVSFICTGILFNFIVKNTTTD